MTDTPSECARLGAELHLLRERSGLTLSALAAKSPYSRSSWQRYLAGQALPPWPAVQTLCGLADEPEPRLRALWELADSAWSRRTATHATPSDQSTPSVPSSVPSVLSVPSAPSTEPDRPESPPVTDVRTGMPTGEPSPRRARKRWAIGVASGAVAVLAYTALAVSAAADRAPSGQSMVGFHVGCTGTACNGLDPGTTLCGVEPQTLLHVQTATGVGLEIRYNPLCQAAWARVWNAATDDTLTFSTPGQPSQSTTVSHPSNIDPFSYTPLVAVAGKSLPLKACVTISPGKVVECYTAPPP
ncbi:helix-turn-helix protein [Streptomyces sp. 846.5]|nr:XRE family transcriptional regulator [Streptomyces sp. 846.5]TDT98395.1 helix-turn-helix protein [Streptomyces sp. 846.5]